MKKISIVSYVSSLPLVAALTVGSLTIAHADGPPPPPKEAYEACAKSSEGDACKVSMPDHEVAGKCTSDHEKQLFCRPEGPPPEPPKEAIDACASSKEDDACVVHFKDRDLSGKCRTMPEHGLVCMPDGPPPHR
jgi:hypothetical protein